MPATVPTSLPIRYPLQGTVIGKLTGNEVQEIRMNEAVGSTNGQAVTDTLADVLTGPDTLEVELNNPKMDRYYRVQFRGEADRTGAAGADLTLRFAIEFDIDGVPQGFNLIPNTFFFNMQSALADASWKTVHGTLPPTKGDDALWSWPAGNVTAIRSRLQVVASVAGEIELPTEAKMGLTIWEFQGA